MAERFSGMSFNKNASQTLRKKSSTKDTRRIIYKERVNVYYCKKFSKYINFLLL